jgi:hypothetical protein
VTQDLAVAKGRKRKIGRENVPFPKLIKYPQVVWQPSTRVLSNPASRLKGGIE